jgi:hypothetical protein
MKVMRTFGHKIDKATEENSIMRIFIIFAPLLSLLGASNQEA